MFEFDVVRFTPTPERTRHEAVDAEAVLALVRGLHDDAAWVLDIVSVERGVGRGSCIVWFRNDRTRVRVDDCLVHLARDPKSRVDDSDTQFVDDDGSLFTVPCEQVLARARGLDTLSHWLRTGERWSEMNWD